MAQRVSVVLVDDIDQSEASETVTFGLDGAQYEIDLSESNADKLRETLALYIGHGREVNRSGRRRGGGGGSARSGRSGRSARSSGDGPSAADIREWARANGHTVPDRGRVSAEVREAYAAAH